MKKILLSIIAIALLVALSLSVSPVETTKASLATTNVQTKYFGKSVDIDFSLSPYKFSQDGSLLRVISTVWGTVTENTTQLSGTNINQQLVMFPSGYSVHRGIGDEIYIHMAATNGAMSSGSMWITVKAIIYFTPG